VLSSSADGVTWVGPSRVPATNAVADYVIPGIAVDPARTGALALTYYRTGRSGQLDVEVVSSRNGGRSWSAPRRLNPQSLRLDWVAQAGGAMVGDYISTSFTGGRAVPVFVLASPPSPRLDQPLFAASIPVG
jgi:hypothetical protein